MADLRTAHRTGGILANTVKLGVRDLSWFRGPFGGAFCSLGRWQVGAKTRRAILCQSASYRMPVQQALPESNGPWLSLH